MKNGMMQMMLWILVIVVVGMFAYIRLAPSDPMRWHQPVAATSDKDMAGGAVRVIAAGPDGLARADAIAQTMPRTTVLAGSVAEGRVTYITRTKIIGFPDYTTLEQDGETLRMIARLRFGRSDMGVNSARLRQLILALE
ncbi:MAG: hypothetical protein ACI9PY_001829 [Ascidiaceihabitans sp.]|jgi:hypothetical protein